MRPRRVRRERWVSPAWTSSIGTAIHGDRVLQPNTRQQFAHALLGQLFDVISRGIPTQDDPLRSQLAGEIANPPPAARLPSPHCFEFPLRSCFHRTNPLVPIA